MGTTPRGRRQRSGPLDYYRAHVVPVLLVPTGRSQQRCTGGQRQWRTASRGARSLLADETIGHFGRAAIAPFIGGLRAQAGEFSKARVLLDRG